MRAAAICVILLLSVGGALFAQTYTEVLEADWGPGLEYTRPAIVDLDQDGLLDLVVGGAAGTLAHYEQTEAGSDHFTLITGTSCAIDVGASSAPCFADLDSDGLLDLIIGAADGRFTHYEQEEAAPHVFALVPGDLGNLYVGAREATPVIADLDGDGLLDLIVGQYPGTLVHYEQAEAASISFVLLSDEFNGINVQMSSIPQLTDLDSDGLLDLIVTGNRVGPQHYEQESIDSVVFTPVPGTFDDTGLTRAAAVCFADLDGNGLMDMIAGTQEGALVHYEQTSSSGFEPRPEPLVDVSPTEVPAMAAPFLIDLDDDGRLDLIIGRSDGWISLCVQDEQGSLAFTRLTDRLGEVFNSYQSRPCVADIDGDGLLDMLVGTGDGKLSHYEQLATGSLAFSYVGGFADINVGSRASPYLIDLDTDGLLDLLVGTGSGVVFHYEQAQTGAETFVLISEAFDEINTGSQAQPRFTDLDDDGLLDLVVADGNGQLRHYEQGEHGSEAFTLVEGTFDAIPRMAFAVPCFGDVNGDGLDDLLLGTSYGGVRCFLRND